MQVSGQTHQRNKEALEAGAPPSPFQPSPKQKGKALQSGNEGPHVLVIACLHIGLWGSLILIYFFRESSGYFGICLGPCWSFTFYD